MSAEEAEPAPAARRSTGRLRLRLPAQALAHSGVVRLVLCDLSAGGAKVFAKVALPLGRDIVLRWGNHEAFGAVVWVREGFHGVQFDEPLANAVLTDTRHLQDTTGMNRDALAEWMADKGYAFGKAL